jgi:hypothetical protein
MRETDNETMYRIIFEFYIDSNEHATVSKNLDQSNSDVSSKN